ncbi:MAG: ubiquitin-like small modifier protein 1 [Nitrososphaerota archaeon]
MKVVVKAYATIREAIDEYGRIMIELSDHATVKDLLDALSRRFGERFNREVLETDGTLKKTVKVFVNGRDIEFINGLSTELDEGDEVVLIPPVAGG